jgi:hypothetical protein
MLLTEIAVTDKRTIGRPDVEVWAAVLDEGMPLEFARTAALAHFRDNPDLWLAPGHIHQRWRAHVRDQLAREEDAAREARQAALDARNVADLGVAALAAGKGIPEIKYFRRSQQPGGNPLTVACPWCKASPGQHCRFPNSTERTKHPHPSRMDALAATHTTTEAQA